MSRSNENEIEILIGKMNTPFTDSKKRTWHILEREDGSISVYYTTADSPAHNIVYDTLNIEPPCSTNLPAKLFSTR